MRTPQSIELVDLEELATAQAAVVAAHGPDHALTLPATNETGVSLFEAINTSEDEPVVFENEDARIIVKSIRKLARQRKAVHHESARFMLREYCGRTVTRLTAPESEPAPDRPALPKIPREAVARPEGFVTEEHALLLQSCEVFALVNVGAAFKAPGEEDTLQLLLDELDCASAKEPPFIQLDGPPARHLHNWASRAAEQVATEGPDQAAVYMLEARRLLKPDEADIALTAA